MESIKSHVLALLQNESATSFLITPDDYDYFFPMKRSSSPVKKETHLDTMPEIRKIVTERLPDAPLTTTIPDDTVAKRQAELWKQKHLEAHVLVTAFGESDETLAMLKNLAKAIDQQLAPAQLVNGHTTDWKTTLETASLKLIVAPPLASWKSTPLATFYRENPTSQTYLIGDVPLFFMQPPTAYLKNPDLKRDLWKTLSSLLSTST